MDISYFSGKLECYFNFKELEYRRLEPSLAELERIGREHTGSSQVPLVYDSLTDTWLRDTTPIIERFEADPELTSPTNRAVPTDAVMAFLGWLLEDYADESLWRLGMFYRWAPTLDADVMSRRFTYEFAAELPWPGQRFLPRFVRAATARARQVMFSVDGEDLRDEAGYATMERDYVWLLDALEEILATTPFVLGERPSVADFGLMGPFFRHLSHDPTPRKIMQQRAPRVYAWCARCFATRASWLDEGARFDPAPSPALRRLVAGAAAQHARYGRLNTEAHALGHTSFRHDDGTARPVVAYRAWSFAQLQQKLVATDPAARATLETMLRECGAWADLFSEEATAGDETSLEACIRAVSPEGGTTPPLCAPGRSPVVSEKWPLRAVLRRRLLGDRA